MCGPIRDPHGPAEGEVRAVYERIVADRRDRFQRLGFGGRAEALSNRTKPQPGGWGSGDHGGWGCSLLADADGAALHAIGTLDPAAHCEALAHLIGLGTAGGGNGAADDEANGQGADGRRAP